MFVPLSEPVKFRVEPDMKQRWDALLERKKITQQDAGLALVQWLLESDDLLQSMVLGQVNPAEDLAGIVVRRLVKKRGSIPMREAHDIGEPIKRRQRPAANHPAKA